MKRLVNKMHIPFIVFVMLMSFSSISSAITVDGSLSDWGISTPGGFRNDDIVGKPIIGNVGSIYYWEEKGVIPQWDGWVQPGSGGQVFDIAGAYFTQEGSNLYFAFIVGMGPQGFTDQYGTVYSMGDIALSFDGNTANGYEYGIETLGPNAGKYYSVTGWTNPTEFPESLPVDIETGTHDSSIDSSLVYSAFGVTDFYVIEAMIETPGYFDILQDKFDIHITQTCGNDVVNFPVPEPSTLLLLGSGLVGLGLFGRRKKA